MWQGTSQLHLLRSLHLLLYLIGSSWGTLKSHALSEMATMLMEEPVFNRLRTEEQLGYTVYSMLRNTFGVLGISISIYAQARFLV